MRQIGSIQSESQARVLRAYLIHLGVPTDVEQNRDGAWGVWVHNEHQVDEAKAAFEEFITDPRNERYRAGAREGAEKEKQQESANKKTRARTIDMRTVITSGRYGGSVALTGALIAISVGVMLYQKAPVDFDIQQLLAISRYSLSVQGWMYQPGLPEVLGGQVWRLLTPIFLHGGLLHILFNMMWLWHLGSVVERVEGWKKLAAHVLLYGIAGNVLQYLNSGPAFGGMSGVNYGLFAYVWILGKYGHNDRYFIDPVNAALMIVWFFACLFGLVGNIANSAHAAGLVLGLVWATIKIRRIPFTRIRF